MMSVYQTSKSEPNTPEKGKSSDSTPQPQGKEQEPEQQLIQLRQQIVAIAHRMGQAENVEKLLQVSVDQLQEKLNCDRALIYHFETENQGHVLAEAKNRGWTPTEGETLPATTFGFDSRQEYLDQTLVIVEKKQPQLTPYQQQLLERFQIQSSATVPIIIANNLWGLLSVQQCENSRQWSESEKLLLEQISIQLTLSLQQSEYQKQLQGIEAREQALAGVIEKVRRSLDQETIFKNLTQEVRNFMNADRVGVYRFDENWSGEFIAESVGGNWVKLVGPGIKTVWEDTHLQDTQGGRYRYHEVFAVDDIYKAGHSPCHVDILEQFEVKAYLIVPIFVGEKLWGLLGVYQNANPRHWTKQEVQEMERVASQLWEVLQQADNLQQLKSSSEQLAQSAERERTTVKIVDRIRRSLDLNNLFNTTAREIRGQLKADRVGVFRFYPGSGFDDGEFVSEDVNSNYSSAVKAKIHDHCFGSDYADKYENGRIQAVSDIYNAGLQECHIEVLSQFQVRANLIVPILRENKLWGLLCVHQCAEPREWQENEIEFVKQIAAQFGVALQQTEYLEQIQTKSKQLAESAERERTLTKVVDRIRKSFDLETIFRTTTQEVRQMIKTDRIAIYKFRPDYFGDFIAESEAPGEPKLAGPDRLTAWEDPYLNEEKGGRFQENKPLVVDDVYNADLTDCHVEALEMFHVKACVVVAIFKGDQLWGLLSAFDNKKPRHWENYEVELLRQVANQIGIAIQQAEYLKELQTQSTQLEASAQREKQAKEEIEMRAVQLLRAVRPALDGDLTVRAPVTEDVVGTIADAYNNTLESLRKLVRQVQKAAEQVALTSNNSDAAIGGLTTSAREQSQDIAQALDKIEQMVASTNAVVENARLVEIAVQRANQTVETGDTAMNRTVDSIQVIRDTVAQTAKKIKSLSDSSQKISKAVNLIGNFATQTNVLALNAAIEATRAGEYGKGFAVVAEEVRSLSRQSAEATKEIEELVKEIQEGTGEVAATMEKGIQQVVEGTNLVNETRESLNEIVSSTTEISQLVESITQATQVQTQQSQLVTKVMTEVAEVANQTSGESTQMSASFKELLDMAQELLTTTGKFKVD